MLELICRARPTFEQYAPCLREYIKTDKVSNASFMLMNAMQGRNCMGKWVGTVDDSEEQCRSLQETAACAARQIDEQCGSDTVTFSFSAMTQYAEQVTTHRAIYIFITYSSP